MAEAGLRIKAFLYDYLLIVAYLIALSGIGAFLTLGPWSSAWSDLLSTPARTDLLAFLVSVMPVVLYFTAAESSAAGATWGKKRVGIQVVDAEGGRLTPLRAFSRSCLKFLPWQMAHTAMIHIPGFPESPSEPPMGSLLLLGAVWLLVGVYLLGLTRFLGHRTLYDRLVSSQVIFTRSHA
jgi:uncharacterized RDD family membrane protein YckC